MKVRRLFPSDKNYLLSSAQENSKKSLIIDLVAYVKQYYLQVNNPLGVVDDVVAAIQQAKCFPAEAFDAFYHDLAAIYRFKHGELQLELLFNGMSHDEKYLEDWRQFFKQSIESYCKNRFFLRAVLDIAVFHYNDRVAFLAGARLKYFLAQHHELRVYRYRGILQLSG